ncbi:Late embryogenesis abundant (LEA) hydroxyproline-rich glycoprotein family [Forsythia ovata]|uniref:Late embryogenesis abundant (LEA) hydroxyproline-rich glycoprotein family n=1 Tax=Forsythia ovata TaxID=205694 RepID=A0ABD1PYC3_9LAMI
MQQPQFPRSNGLGTKSSRGSTNLASCIVATVFLLCIVVAAVAVYFFLFKPKPPKIAVNAVQFPAFSVTNGTVNFEFFQYVTVTNPNRDEFSHYDSSLQLVYSGEPMGLVFIPAGKIGGGGTQKMSAKFDVQQYPIPTPAKSALSGGDGGIGFDNNNNFNSGGMMAGNTMEIETQMKLVGRVRVLKVFTHRVDSGVRCGVIIEVTRGTVLGFHC